MNFAYSIADDANYSKALAREPNCEVAPTAPRGCPALWH